jgi:hypothetical protein
MATKTQTKTKGTSLLGREGVVERDEKRDQIVTRACGKGWQVLLGVASQTVTERLLKAAARRVKMNIRVTKWADGTTVTFKVSERPVPPAVQLTPTTELEVAPLEGENG